MTHSKVGKPPVAEDSHNMLSYEYVAHHLKSYRRSSSDCTTPSSFSVAASFSLVISRISLNRRKGHDYKFNSKNIETLPRQQAVRAIKTVCAGIDVPENFSSLGPRHSIIRRIKNCFDLRPQRIESGIAGLAFMGVTVQRESLD